MGLFFLSAAALALEVNLTRLFSVAQFYHFAFMTVSLALLGSAASGTILNLAPGLARRPTRTLVALAWGFALTAIGSYVLTQLLPFDSFQVALDPRQWGVLALHYLALSTPFLCAGMAVGLLLAARPEAAGRTYAANLAGSAIGCLVAVAAPALVGGEGVVLLTAGLAGLAALSFSLKHITRGWPLIPQAAVALALLCTSFHLPSFLELGLSPYKSLSYALQYPDARLLFRAWNGFSRVDVVEATAIRSLPGQGFACPGQPPPQRGLFVDGDNLSPITRVSDPPALRPLLDCLLTSLPYRMRPGARVLVLDPRGGFNLLVPLAEGAGSVDAVAPNPLLVRAVREQGAWAGDLYDHPRVVTYEEEPRSFLAHPGSHYDVIIFPPPGSYHPITSGAYSLLEDYDDTVEGFVAALRRLDEGGLLVVVRWLQLPPSESLRSFGVAVEAIARTGGDPTQSLVALRSYNQMLILARRGPFLPREVEQVRAFAAARSFDLVYAPGIEPGEVNRHNLLPTPDYYRVFTALLAAPDREEWARAYPFDVSPPTDDRPFFGHFFRWGQMRMVLQMAGHVWQPFGGAGYLVLLALLVVATAAAGLLVLLPLAGRRAIRPTLSDLTALLPFVFLGFGYLLVEIPLLQRFILFLGHPTYALAAVLGTLLLFSGLGSLLSARVRWSGALAMLVGMVILVATGLPLLSGPLLGLPLAARLAVTMVGLAPLGTLMGMPFPHLLAALRDSPPGLVAWAWGVNGASSVVASVLAAMAALSWGFRAVLLLGGLAYLGAWVSGGRAIRLPRLGCVSPPPSQ